MILLTILILISLVGYGVIVALAVLLLGQGPAGRSQYIVFVLYGSLFYLISTGVHVALPLLLMDSTFARPEHRRKRLLLLVIPAAMLAYMIREVVRWS